MALGVTPCLIRTHFEKLIGGARALSSHGEIETEPTRFHEVRELLGIGNHERRAH